MNIPVPAESKSTMIRSPYLASFGSHPPPKNPNSPHSPKLAGAGGGVEWRKRGEILFYTFTDKGAQEGYIPVLG
ncbi:hypothetical protein E2C01_011712 [Portunus trituberculatus]|uniref:Uncharacterized protein n=1 Tax=Portunus trituberculatus TaxID=210409 RepID=A0A5B7DBU9_PORTR|nr:hypothetical protein [Portunus trituberculatus]